MHRSRNGHAGRALSAEPHTLAPPRQRIMRAAVATTMRSGARSGPIPKPLQELKCQGERVGSRSRKRAYRAASGARQGWWIVLHAGTFRNIHHLCACLPEGRPQPGRVREMRPEDRRVADREVNGARPLRTTANELSSQDNSGRTAKTSTSLRSTPCDTRLMQGGKAMLPVRVVAGDKVRLVSPASYPDPEWIEESVRILEGWGLIPPDNPYTDNTSPARLTVIATSAAGLPSRRTSEYLRFRGPRACVPLQAGDRLGSATTVSGYP